MKLKRPIPWPCLAFETMDPSNPGMLPGTSSGYVAALPHPEVVKVKKAKKHKKHHRHDDGESPAMSGGAAGAAAAGLKLKIKLGDDPSSGGGSGRQFNSKKCQFLGLCSIFRGDFWFVFWAVFEVCSL